MTLKLCFCNWVNKSSTWDLTIPNTLYNIPQITHPIKTLWQIELYNERVHKYHNTEKKNTHTDSCLLGLMQTHDLPIIGIIAKTSNFGIEHVLECKLANTKRIGMPRQV